jgi:membrane protease YdiL (CAAX protease family)
MTVPGVPSPLDGRSGGSPAPRDPPALRAAVIRHPAAAFLVLVLSISVVLALLPIPAGLYGPLENILGMAVPAFLVTAVVGGRDGVRDLAGRCLRWRVALRWYALALLALPVGLLLALTALYGADPLRALGDNWPLVFTSFLPTLAFMVVLNNVAEEAGWTGFLFARLQDRHGPIRAALLVTVAFWLWHLPGFVHDAGWALGAALAGFLLLPHLASRLIVGWLYNATGASVLIAGLFHAMHNATVNPTGLGVAVLDLPQVDVLVVLSGIVVLAGVAVVVATRRRLGRPESRGVARHPRGSSRTRGGRSRSNGSR